MDGSGLRDRLIDLKCQQRGGQHQSAQRFQCRGRATAGLVQLIAMASAPSGTRPGGRGWRVSARLQAGSADIEPIAGSANERRPVELGAKPVPP
jgi:hypothetical protein